MFSLSKTLFPLVLVASICSATTAQQPDPPMDPTVWQKLGIRNAVRRFQTRRDALVNRNGNRPQAEKKPKLLKLADPKLLELPDKPEFKPIKVAAEAKFAEDLAPQKVKAVKYLASLGCGCRSEIAPALLEALKDCNADVRTAAVEAIMTTAERVDSCEGRRKLKLGKRDKKRDKNKKVRAKKATAACGCGGSGSNSCCDSCCDTCVVTSCNVCGACCNKDIQEQLEKMANGQKKDGCYDEPVAAIRQLAQQALLMCPPIPDDRDDETVEEPKVDVEGEKEKNGTQNRDDQAYYRMYEYSNSTRAPSTNVSAKSISISDRDREHMVIGKLTGSGDPTRASIKFADALAIPRGTKLTVIDEHGSIQHVQVYDTDVGRVQIQTLGNESLRLNKSSKVSIGILAN